MTTSESSKINEAPLGRDLLHAVRYYLGNWRLLIILAIVAVIGGIWFNWGWLVALGIAPVLLSALPCLVMCGLGLCMHKMGSKSSASQPAPSQNTDMTARLSDSPQAVGTTKSLLAGVSSCCGTTADKQPATVPQQNQTSDERRTPHA